MSPQGAPSIAQNGNCPALAFSFRGGVYVGNFIFIYMNIYMYLYVYIYIYIYIYIYNTGVLTASSV